MLAYTIRRILGAIPTLFVIITLTFFMIRLAPGGPFDQEQTLPPEIEANLLQFAVVLALFVTGALAGYWRYQSRSRLFEAR